MYNYLSSCIKDACCKEGHLVNKSVVGLFVVTDDFWEGPQTLVWSDKTGSRRNAH